jgi:sugar/nucleoside kinase (ribokinase family)
MYSYDLAFVGHICIDETINYDGSSNICTGGAALYGAVAAAGTGKKIAAVVMLLPKDHEELSFLQNKGIDVLTIDSPQTTRVKVVHTSCNVDQRNITTDAYAGRFIDIPQLSTRHMHLAGCNDHEFDLDFIRKMKNRGYCLSADMQSFVRHNDSVTKEILFKDDPDKIEVLSLVDKVKLDILEAKILTGTDDIEKAAGIVNSWGCPEVLITCSDGAVVRYNDQNYFEKFTNKSVVGRTGRGDTTFGAYLAWRIDHDPVESLKFAAALVSIKMETPGPFSGTIKNVFERMK